VYSRVPVSVTVSKKSAGRMAWACERRNVAEVVLVRWDAGFDTGLAEDLPHG
jgi:hypothetical protein